MKTIIHFNETQGPKRLDSVEDWEKIDLNKLYLWSILPYAQNYEGSVLYSGTGRMFIEQIKDIFFFEFFLDDDPKLTDRAFLEKVQGGLNGDGCDFVDLFEFDK